MVAPPSKMAAAAIRQISSRPPSSIVVRTTFSRTDSEMPRKLIAATTIRNTTAVTTIGMSTKTLR